MRPLRVVVRRVYGQHPAEVSLPEDQHPVGQLGADGQHEALGEAVRRRTPWRDLDHVDAGIRQYRVERGCEMSGSIADEEPEPPDVLAVSWSWAWMSSLPTSSFVGLREMM